MKHPKNETERKKAIKKAEIAIDKLVDLQDMGFGCNRVSEALDRLNGFIIEIYIK
jgi:hypothetical protein